MTTSYAGSIGVRGATGQVGEQVVLAVLLHRAQRRGEREAGTGADRVEADLSADAASGRSSRARSTTASQSSAPDSSSTVLRQHVDLAPADVEVLAQRQLDLGHADDPRRPRPPASAAGRSSSLGSVTDTSNASKASSSACGRSGRIAERSITSYHARRAAGSVTSSSWISTPHGTATPGDAGNRLSRSTSPTGRDVGQ